MIKYWIKISSALTLSLVFFLTVACSNSPVKEADTFEQKSYALYGTYVIYQGKAAQLKQDRSVPDRAKRVLSAADAIAYPVSLALLDAALVVTDVRELLEECQSLPTPAEKCQNTSEEKLNLALVNLSTIYFEAKPKLLAVKTAFDSAKTTRTP